MSGTDSEREATIAFPIQQPQPRLGQKLPLADPALVVEKKCKDPAKSWMIISLLACINYRGSFIKYKNKRKIEQFFKRED